MAGARVADAAGCRVAPWWLMGEDPAAAQPGGPNAPRKSSLPAGGFAGINARTREMAAAKLPPRLQAKLSENARISALTAGPPSSTMKHDEKLDSSLLMPTMPSTAPRPGPRPNLRLSDMGSEASASGQRRRPDLTLGGLPSKAPTPFGSFSKIVDPSGRLVFDG